MNIGSRYVMALGAGLCVGLIAGMAGAQGWSGSAAQGNSSRSSKSRP